MVLTFGFGKESVAQGFSPGFKKERSPETRALTPFCQKSGFVKGIKKEAALVGQPLFNHLNLNFYLLMMIFLLDVLP